MALDRVLTFEEEQELFRRYREEGDVSALEEISKCNFHLITFIANRYNCDSVDYDELVSEGYIGLAQALNEFDYTMGNRFSTFAYWKIRNSVEKVVNSNAFFASVCSLDNQIREDGTVLGSVIPSSDKTPAEHFEYNDSLSNIFRAIDVLLDSRERDIIIKHFGLFDSKRCTFKEIGAMYGLSDVRIKQIESEAINKIRNGLGESLAA